MIDYLLNLEPRLGKLLENAYSKSLFFLFCRDNQLDTVGLQHRGLDDINFMNPRHNPCIHKDAV